MAVKRRRKPRVRIAAEIIDATPERIAMDASEFVNPATIDSSEQAIGYVRRFRSSKLDRLRNAGRLSDRQFMAGDWYRECHARCSYALSVVASYGERTSAGEPSYGLARTEAQARARDMLRRARKAFSPAMLGFMERFLIHDALPRYGGGAAMRDVRQIGMALDALADWLKLPEGR